jgi:hypothetical protein
MNVLRNRQQVAFDLRAKASLTTGQRAQLAEAEQTIAAIVAAKPF